MSMYIHVSKVKFSLIIIIAKLICTINIMSLIYLSAFRTTAVYVKRILQYCAEVMQAKCANVVLCSCELSSRICSKVLVTIQGFLSEISVHTTKSTTRRIYTFPKFETFRDKVDDFTSSQSYAI